VPATPLALFRPAQELTRLAAAEQEPAEGSVAAGPHAERAAQAGFLMGPAQGLAALALAPPESAQNSLAQQSPVIIQPIAARSKIG